MIVINEAVLRQMLACANRHCPVCTAWVRRWWSPGKPRRRRGDPGE